MIFQGIRTSIAKKPYIFVIFRGGGGGGRLMGYFPIILMKLFELHMFELDINTNLRHLWSVFLLVRVTYVTFFKKLHIMAL